MADVKGIQLLLLAMSNAPLDALRDPAAYRNLKVTFTPTGGKEQTWDVQVFQADATVLPKWREG